MVERHRVYFLRVWIRFPSDVTWRSVWRWVVYGRTICGEERRLDDPRVDDCGTLVSGRSVASLRCPSPATSGRSASSPKRTLTDNGRLLAHITNAALRPDKRIRRTLCRATEPHGTVQASTIGKWPWPMLLPVRNSASSCCGFTPHGA